MAKPSHTRTITPADLKAKDRLQALWKARAKGLGVSQDTVAEMLDGSQGLVSQYYTGKLALNFKALLAFAKALQVDPSEIRSDLPEQQLGGAAARAALDDDWRPVNAFAQAVGLGSGPEAAEYAESHKLKFRASSLAKKRLHPGSLAVFYGSGDSMLPRISAGDAILFDTSDTKPRDGKLYVIAIDGAGNHEYQVKRAMILDSAVYFVADNPSGDHAWTKPRRMSDERKPIEIIGRVRWIGSWED